MNLASNRFFGIEIECKGMSMGDAERAINAAGIECHIESYGHSTPRTWKIVTDASVSEGFEVVSPKLQGNEGLEQVRKVSAALVAAGAKVRRDCGFHVHVDAHDLNAKTLYNIAKRYAAHESVIDTFMPRSRRGANNRFCMPVEGLLSYLSEPSTHSSTRSFISNLGERRYFKLNLAAFLRHSTVEFRQHSGTVEAHKMIPWIIFCINFVEQSIINFVSPTAGARRTAPSDGLRANSVERKFHAFAVALRENTTVTVDQAAEIFGCAATGVPSYISRFRSAHPNIPVSTRRGRGYSRSYMTTEQFAEFNRYVESMPVAPSADAPTVAPWTEPGLFAGLDPEIVSYFQERAEDLAGTN